MKTFISTTWARYAAWEENGVQLGAILMHDGETLHQTFQRAALEETARRATGAEHFDLCLMHRLAALGMDSETPAPKDESALEIERLRKCFDTPQVSSPAI